MASEGPKLKLLVNKPKKEQLKRVEYQQQCQQPSPSMASPAPPSSAAAAAPPPPQPPKESMYRRYRFIVPLVLGVNLVYGAYLFMRTKKKDGVEEAEVPNALSTPVSAVEKPVSQPAIAMAPAVVLPPKPREPIPENEQRELFKWLLEEKRKLKPKDSAERKRIDEEKALLKEFIRAKSIPIL